MLKLDMFKKKNMKNNENVIILSILFVGNIRL